jgi:hypothetical protein
MRMRATIALLGLAVLACSACSERAGLIELAWQFDNAKLQRIYPLSDLADTCGIASQSGIRYDLQVRLTIVENTPACAADLSNLDCQVLEPISFPCNRFRGTAKDVPISAVSDGSDPGYLMLVEAVIDPTDTPAFVPDPNCLTAPGPRVRSVRPGRITDLEVYQFVVSGIESEGALLDIDACRPSEDAGDGDGDGDGDSSTGTDGTGTDSTT